LLALVSQALLLVFQFSQLGFQSLLLRKEFLVGVLSLGKLLRQIVELF